MKFMMDLVTLLRRIIYVFCDEDFSRQVIYGTFDPRFQQHEFFCVEHKFLVPL